MRFQMLELYLMMKISTIQEIKFVSEERDKAVMKINYLGKL